MLDVAQLSLAPPIEVDDASATQAALLRARHYNKKKRAVSLADCVVAHAARTAASAVAPSGTHLLDLCRDEGIALIPLPDSSGRICAPRNSGGRRCPPG